jgi:hypothetical protein
MAEDRAYDPARKPNLGLPNFVQDKLVAKPVVKITKVTDLGTVGPESEGKPEVVFHRGRGKKGRSND